MILDKWFTNPPKIMMIVETKIPTIVMSTHGGNIDWTGRLGDAFLAGFIAYRYQRVDVTDCLRWGLACAAANTQRSGAGVFDPDEVERIFPATGVTELVSELPE